MLLAFGGAGCTDISAKLAEVQRERATAGHELGSQTTDGRAISIESNAFSHPVDFGLTEASRRAVIALGGAVIAGFDAVRELSMTHGEHSLSIHQALHAPFHTPASGRPGPRRADL
jgi:hypothetical protein